MIKLVIAHFTLENKLSSLSRLTLCVAGVEIIRNALRVPITQIVKNTGVDPTRVVEVVVNAELNKGYDALQGKHVDMMEEGIVDPTKVHIHVYYSYFVVRYVFQ